MSGELAFFELGCKTSSGAGLCEGSAGVSGAEIARRCGYYDQAHLIRDFNQFAGGPPGGLATRRLPDDGGVVGS